MGDAAVNFIKSDAGIVAILTLLLFALVKFQDAGAAVTGVIF